MEGALKPTKAWRFKIYAILLWLIRGAMAQTQNQTQNHNQTTEDTQGKGDKGDEFSNNLFSDLAPLLALFGEQFAKQFMSHSLTIADNIVFAMAPIGIITAIVGAIRTGGPAWLRSIIGRARENLAAAEVEYMSSVSHEVCEVWNGSSVVRIPGSPEIQMFVYISELRDVMRKGQKTFGIFTLEDKEVAETLDISGFGFDFIWNLKALRQKNANLDAESKKPESPYFDIAPHERDKLASNITLNLARSRLDLLVAGAVIGIIVQATVLVLGAIFTYKFRWLKGGEKVANYAYPFTTSGTLLLVIGMFICASVIEQSTREFKWAAKPSENSQNATSSKTLPKLHVVWMQRELMINDQSFESFALFSRRTLDFILTSYPAYLLAIPKMQHGTKNSHETRKAQMRKLHIWTSIGTFISVFGFVCQFVGLRAMHFSASISQLVATGIMIVVRVCLRWKLTSEPSSEKLTKGHELDWLARGHEAGNFWEERLLPEKGNFVTQTFNWCKKTLGFGVGVAANSSSGNEATKIKCARWSLATVGNSQECTAIFQDEEPLDQNIRDSLTAPAKTSVCSQKQAKNRKNSTAAVEGSDLFQTPSTLNIAEHSQGTQIRGTSVSTSANSNQNLPEQNHRGNSRPQKTLDIRKRLRGLSKWKGPYLDQATILAKCMEEVLNSPEIVKIGISRKYIAWNLEAEVFGKEDEASGATQNYDSFIERSKIQFTATRSSEGGLWIVDVVALESAISLWIESTTIQNKDAERVSSPSSPPAKNSSGDDRDLPRNGLLLLGPSIPASRRDLHWWLSSEFVSQLREISFGNSTSSSTLSSKPSVWNVEMEGADFEGKTEHKVERNRVVGFGFELKSENSTAPQAASTQRFQNSIKTARHVPEILSQTSSSEPSSTPLQGISSTEPNEAGRTCLAWPTFTTLVDLYARHLFTGFIWAICPYMDISSETRLVHPNPENGDKAESPAFWNKLHLQNDPLNNLGVRLSALELLGRNPDECLALIIPPLTSQNKLRLPSTILQSIHYCAAKKIKADQWADAWKIYDSLSSVCSTFGTTNELATVAHALKITFHEVICCELFFEEMKGAHLNSAAVTYLQRIKAAAFKSIQCDPSEQSDLIQFLFVQVQGGLPGWLKYCDAEDEIQLDRIQDADVSDYGSSEFNAEESSPDEQLHCLGQRLGWNDSHRLAASFRPPPNADSGAELDVTPQLKALIPKHEINSLRETDLFGRTAFHYAAMRGRWKVLNLLLEDATSLLSTDYDLADIFGWTPFHYFSWYSEYQEAPYQSLGQGASKDVKDFYGKTPFLLACEGRNRRMVHDLLQSGQINRSTKSHHGNALQLAVKGPSIRLRDRKILIKNPQEASPTMGILENILSYGVDFRDSIGEEGITPFHLSARSRNSLAFTILCNHGFAGYMLHGDRRGNTCIHMAATLGCTEIVETILSLAVDYGLMADRLCDLKNEDGQTALHLAAQSNQAEMIGFLAQQGVDMNARDRNGQTPLHAAAYLNKCDAVKAILNDSSSSLSLEENALGLTPLHRAAEKGHIQIVKLLIGTWKYRAGSKIANAGELELVTNSVVKNITRNQNTTYRTSTTPRNPSLLSRSVKIQTRLRLNQYYQRIALNTDADDVQDPESPEEDAESNMVAPSIKSGFGSDATRDSEEDEGRYTVPVEHFPSSMPLEAFSDIRFEVWIGQKDRNGATALHSAARSGHSEMIELLLAALYAGSITTFGADIVGLISEVDSLGRTALHYAAMNGHSEVIRTLTKYGAAVNVLDTYGLYPLYYVFDTLEPSKSSFDALINAGARMSIEGAKCTILHAWADRGFKLQEPSKFLTQPGMPPDERDEIGRTALRLAVNHKNLEAVRFLLGHNADPNARAADNLTPLSAALDAASTVQNDLEIVRALAERGMKEAIEDDYSGLQLLGTAITRDNLALLRILCEGLDEQQFLKAAGLSQNRNVLHTASVYGGAQVMKFLLQQPGSMKLFTSARLVKDEYTLLDIAILGRKSGDRQTEEIVKMILEADASGILKDSTTGYRDYSSPLITSIRVSNLKVASVLITAGANVNYRTPKGNSSLYTACGLSEEDKAEAIVRALLDAGATGIYEHTQIGGQPKDSNGASTALHLSIHRGHLRVTERLLVQDGIYKEVKNSDGCSPLDFALCRGEKQSLFDGCSPLDFALCRGEKQSLFESLILQSILPRWKNAQTEINTLSPLACLKTSTLKTSTTEGKKRSVSKLHHAVIHTFSEQLIEGMMRLGADPSIPDSDGNTVLHYVSQNIGRATTYGLDLKELAAPIISRAARMEAIMEVLLRKQGQKPALDVPDYEEKFKTFVNSKDSKGNAAIHYAVRCRSLKGVQLLLEHGAVVDCLDENGMFPFQLAMGLEDENIAKVVLENHKGCTGPLNSLLSYDAQPVELEFSSEDKAPARKSSITSSKILRTALQEAASGLSADFLAFLLKLGAMDTSSLVDTEGNSALLLSLSPARLLTNRVEDVASLILRDCTQLNTINTAATIRDNSSELDNESDKGELNGRTPLYIAVEAGLNGLAELLLQHNAAIIPPDHPPGSGRVSFLPLIAAAREGDILIAKQLLNKAKLGARDGDNALDKHDLAEKSSNTALHVAVESGNLGMVELFLMNKANPTVHNAEGSTPLHLACQLGHSRIVSVLLSNGAVVDTYDSRLRTPIHYASQRGSDLEIIQLLCKASARIDLPDRIGETPLHLACRHGHENIALFLIEQLLGDARDKSKEDTLCLTRNAQGWTPLHCASKSGNLNIFSKLFSCSSRSHRDLYTFGGSNSFIISAQFRRAEILRWLSAEWSTEELRLAIIETLLWASVQKDREDVLIFAVAKTEVFDFDDLGGRATLITALNHNFMDFFELIFSKLEPEIMYGSISDPEVGQSGRVSKGAKLLAEKGAFVIHDNLTILHIAALYGRKRAVSILEPLQNDIERLYLHSSFYSNPLHLAVISGHSDIAHAITEWPGVPLFDYPDVHGWTTAGFIAKHYKSDDRWNHIYDMISSATAPKRTNSEEALLSTLKPDYKNIPVRSKQDIQIARTGSRSQSRSTWPRRSQTAPPTTPSPAHPPQSTDIQFTKDSSNSKLSFPEALGPPTLGYKEDKDDDKETVLKLLPPSCWSDLHKADLAEQFALEDDSMVVVYKADVDLFGDNTFSIMADHPVPYTDEDYYFEIQILDLNRLTLDRELTIYIGLTNGYTATDVVPGSCSQSIAMDVNTGVVWKDEMILDDFDFWGPAVDEFAAVKKDDTFGVGIRDKKLYFTKNGRLLERGLENVSCSKPMIGKFFPILGVANKLRRYVDSDEDSESTAQASVEVDSGSPENREPGHLDSQVLQARIAGSFHVQSGSTSDSPPRHPFRFDRTDPQNEKAMREEGLIADIMDAEYPGDIIDVEYPGDIIDAEYPGDSSASDDSW